MQSARSVSILSVGSVGLPGRLKSSVTWFRYAHWSNALLANSGPLSTRIIFGYRRSLDDLLAHLGEENRIRCKLPKKLPANKQAGIQLEMRGKFQRVLFTNLTVSAQNGRSE